MFAKQKYYKEGHMSKVHEERAEVSALKGDYQ